MKLALCNEDIIKKSKKYFQFIVFIWNFDIQLLLSTFPSHFLPFLELTLGVNSEPVCICCTNFLNCKESRDVCRHTLLVIENIMFLLNKVILMPSYEYEVNVNFVCDRVEWVAPWCIHSSRFWFIANILSLSLPHLFHTFSLYIKNNHFSCLYFCAYNMQYMDYNEQTEWTFIGNDYIVQLKKTKQKFKKKIRKKIKNFKYVRLCYY